MAPDPKPEARIKDKRLTKLLHIRGVICVLCGKPGSLHHVWNHPRHDLPENFVGLCGDGTTGHHGLITNEDEATRRALGAYLGEHKFETVIWLRGLIGEEEANAWLQRHLFMEL
jgi:hypothetical protein